VGGDPGTASRPEAHAVDIDLRERELALREAELREQIAARQQQAAELELRGRKFTYKNSG